MLLGSVTFFPPLYDPLSVIDEVRKSKPRHPFYCTEHARQSVRVRHMNVLGLLTTSSEICHARTEDLV